MSEVTTTVADELPPTPSGPSDLGGPFWTLVGSSGLSNVADGVFKIALPLLALRFTRSPVAIAGLEIVRSAPWLLIALQVGALADRWDRRRTMLAANAVRAIAVGVPAVLALRGDGSLELLYVAAAVTGVAEVFHDVTSQSIVPAMVPRHQLARANGRLYAVELGSQQFVAPPLGGFLVGAFALLALWVPAVLWGLAVLALWTVRGSYRPSRSSTAATTIRQDVVEGLRFLRGNRMLRVMAVMVGGMNMLWAAALPLFVLYAVGEQSILGLDEAGFGLLSLAAAAGSLVGSLAAERMTARIGRARTLTGCVAASAATLVVPALTDRVDLVAVAFVVGGFGIMLWNIPTVSFRQTVTPDHLLGRVNSTYRLLAWGTMPLGAALGGLLGEVLPLQVVFGLIGAAGLLLLVPDRVITDGRLAAEEALAEATGGAGSGPATAGDDVGGTAPSPPPTG